MLFAMANTGLPGTSGFVGEFLVIMSAFKANFWVAFAASLTLILAAAYTLWMYKRVFFGKITKEAITGLTDVAGVELWVMILLAVPVIVVGVYPNLLLHLFDHSVSHLLTVAELSKL